MHLVRLEEGDQVRDELAGIANAHGLARRDPAKSFMRFGAV
jgi:hypothetical protein